MKCQSLVAMLEMCEKVRLYASLLLHIGACGYFDFSLCLAHAHISSTHTHTQLTLQTQPSSVLLLLYCCSRCNFYDFEASHTSSRMGIPPILLSAVLQPFQA